MNFITEMGMNFITARIRALWHLVRGHNLRWRVGRDRYCNGDIVCEMCPDRPYKERTGLVLWCRWYDPRWLGGRR